MTNPLDEQKSETKLSGGVRHSDLAGLTRRELFAAMAMQGDCSRGLPVANLMMTNARAYANLADCLLKVLDESPSDQE